MPGQEQEHSCVLRTLTICDGQELTSSDARLRTERCYCALLAEALAQGRELSAQEWRSIRARAVARSSDTRRRMEQRERIRGGPAGAPAF